jgi:hypothetical protein
MQKKGTQINHLGERNLWLKLKHHPIRMPELIKKITNGGGPALCLLLSIARSISVKEALQTSHN